MEKAGLGDEFIRLLDPWRKQLAAGFTTWGESAEIELRSDSHDWSSAPNVQVFTIVAGIRPAAPGFRKVVIRPHLNGLPWVKATVPHPQGEITVNLKAVGDDGLEAEVTLPETLSGTFEWRGEKAPLRGGNAEAPILMSPGSINSVSMPDSRSIPSAVAKSRQTQTVAFLRRRGSANGNRNPQR